MEQAKWKMGHAKSPLASSWTHISFRLPEGPRFRHPGAALGVASGGDAVS